MIATVRKEDRISNLPEDIIQHILSFLDLKYAIQTCILSKRWKLIWTSLPHLNLNSRVFRSLTKFTKFVNHVLSKRNYCADVSALELTFTRMATKPVVRSIVNYAYAHNVRTMTMIWLTSSCNELPHFFSSSHTLKHLTIMSNGESGYFYRNANIAWDFPALETLNLSNMYFHAFEEKHKSLDIFSKCVNLKDLTLHKCKMNYVGTFNVCAPQLSNLTITHSFSFPKVFNVVAPHLKNLTASIWTKPYRLHDSLWFSSDGFNSLETVNLSLSNHSNLKNIYVPHVLNLFQKLRGAKFLILNMDIIETLSKCLDQLSHEICPFNKLKWLKIDTESLKQRGGKAIIPTQLRKYLLENSPNATFIIDLPQKRTWEQVLNDPTAKKIAKLEENIQMQDKVIAEQNAIHEKLMSHIIKGKMKELRVQVESGNPDYQVIRIMGCDIKSAMDLIPKRLAVALEGEFFAQYEELKSQVYSHIDDSHWVKIETELENIRQPNH